MSLTIALAQPPIILPVIFPPQLRQYLELSDEQVLKILTLNTRLGAFLGNKAQRRIQVQIELGIETAKPTIDPMALGLRYLELEAIRREIEAERARTTEDAQKILTPVQKTKLATLQEALRLASTACDAVNQNLIVITNPATQPPPIFPPPIRWFDTSSLASFLRAPAAPCPSTITPVIVGGDFVPGPSVPQP